MSHGGRKAGTTNFATLPLLRCHAIVVISRRKNIALSRKSGGTINLAGPGQPLETVEQEIVPGFPQYLSYPRQHSAAPGTALHNASANLPEPGNEPQIPGVFGFVDDRITAVFSANSSEARAKPQAFEVIRCDRRPQPEIQNFHFGAYDGTGSSRLAKDRMPTESHVNCRHEIAIIRGSVDPTH